MMEQNDALTPALQFLKEMITWRLENTKAPCTDWFQEQEPVTFTAVKNLNLPRELTAEETIILLLALVPHLSPDFLLDTVSDAFPNGSDFPIFGGVKGKNHRGILPTGETVQFIIGGEHFSNRLACNRYFNEDHLFAKYQVLQIAENNLDEPLMSGKLLLHDEALELLTTGTLAPPKMSTKFPAQLLETQLTWDDLILADTTREQIEELQTWLQYNHTLLKDWNMAARIKPGYRALFSGPPGTGKTLTATLLGKYTSHPVYRIDLSTVVSKYIGETEKNLANLLDKAAHKNWILFFDEADAIFGKRTQVRDAHDKYANQEVSYLLQRIESHPGLVILATNQKSNIDEAFTRRFQSICEFSKPGVQQRFQLWQINLPEKLQLSSKIDLYQVAERYELTGANIINVVQYCSLEVLKDQQTELSEPLLLKGIKKEYKKENRLL